MPTNTLPFTTSGAPVVVSPKRLDGKYLSGERAMIADVTNVVARLQQQFDLDPSRRGSSPSSLASPSSPCRPPP
jgi:hypothetical protein